MKSYIYILYIVSHIYTAAAAKSLQSCLTLCDPIDGSPRGSPHPWDSPGKNTGVGCHFLLQCMKVKSKSEVTQSCPTLSDPMDYSLPGSFIHGFSRHEYWSGVPLPVQGIFPTQGLNPGLPHCRQTLYQLSHQGS